MPPDPSPSPNARDRLGDLLALGVPEGSEPPERRRRVQVVTGVAASTIALGLPFVTLYAGIGLPWMSAAVTATIAVGLLDLLWLRRSRDADRAGWIATTALLSLLVTSNAASGGFYDPNFAWLYVVPIYGALMVNARAGHIFTGLVLLVTLAFFAAPYLGVEVPDQIPPEAHARQSLANRVSAVVAIAIGLGGLEARERYSRRLLEEANAGLQAEIVRRSEVQERLVRTERLASMGALAAGMAHEVNNPLTYVIGNLHLLVEELDQLPPERRPQLEPLIRDALDGAARIGSIVADLKTFARSEEEVSEVDLAAVLDRAIKLTASETMHRARLVRDYAPGAVVRANEARLVQVAVHLLENAAHAVATGPRDDNEIRVAIRPEQDELVLEVGDTGPGMDESVLARALEPFFTTRDVGEGKGLGLSICQNIVRDAGGSLALASTPGVGTTVRIRLPSSRGSTP